MEQGDGFAQQLHAVAGEHHALVASHGHELSDDGGRSQFFQQLPGQSGPIILTRLDLSTREFPQACVAPPRGATCHQHRTVTNDSSAHDPHFVHRLVLC